MSGDTPWGSPDGLFPVTNRKLPILIAARSTPVGASSDLTSPGMGVCSEINKGIHLILKAAARHANFLTDDERRKAPTRSPAITGFAKTSDQAFAGCGVPPTRQEGTADGTLRTRQEDPELLRERQSRDQGEPRPHSVAWQARWHRQAVDLAGRSGGRAWPGAQLCTEPAGLRPALPLPAGDRRWAFRLCGTA